MTIKKFMVQSLLGLAMAQPLAPRSGPLLQAAGLAGRQTRPKEGTNPRLGLLPLPSDPRPDVSEAGQVDTLLALDGQLVLDEMEELERFRTRFPDFYARYASDPDFRTHLTAERNQIQGDLSAGGARARNRKLKAELRRVEADLRLLARIRHLEDFKDLFRHLEPAK